MRYNDVLNEQQLDELGVFKDIAAGIQGARSGGGLQGAVSGYKASQSSRQGEEHSSKIVANLKSEYMKTVGGGNNATYKSLMDYLGSWGLQDLEGIPDPTASVTGVDSATTADPTTQPSQSLQPTTSAPSAPTGNPTVPASGSKALGPKGRATLARLGKQKQGRENPEQGQLDLNEDAGRLSNSQIDSIIKAAVQKNYAAIVAAQKGRSLPSRAGVSLGTAPAGTSNVSVSNKTGVTPVNPFSNPRKLRALWNAYINNGGQITPQLAKVIKMMNQGLAAPAPKEEPPAPAPTKPAVDLAHPADDNPNIGLGSNEGFSRFLGMKL